MPDMIEAHFHPISGGIKLILGELF